MKAGPGQQARAPSTTVEILKTLEANLFDTDHGESVKGEGGLVSGLQQRSQLQASTKSNQGEHLKQMSVRTFLVSFLGIVIVK